MHLQNSVPRIFEEFVLILCVQKLLRSAEFEVLIDSSPFCLILLNTWASIAKLQRDRFLWSNLGTKYSEHGPYYMDLETGRPRVLFL